MVVWGPFPCSRMLCVSVKLSLPFDIPQGVTLTDLQEAEKTFSRSRAERQAQEQPGEKLEDPGGLEGSAKKQEPSAAPTKDTGEGQQPWGRGLEEEVSSFCSHALHHK